MKAEIDFYHKGLRCIVFNDIPFYFAHQPDVQYISVGMPRHHSLHGIRCENIRRLLRAASLDTHITDAGYWCPSPIRGNLWWVNCNFPNRDLNYCISKCKELAEKLNEADHREWIIPHEGIRIIPHEGIKCAVFHSGRD